MCRYCDPSGNHDFRPVNQSAEYSDIEMSLSNLGVFRVRVYNGENITRQDVVEMRYCPLCGRKFQKF